MANRKGSNLTLITGAVLFAAVAVAGCKSKPAMTAAVVCSKSVTGVQCTVNQTKGKAAGNVCWDVTLTCKNGTKIIGNGCQSVKPGTPAKKLIPAEELTGHDKCDAVVKSKIQNVRVLRDVSTE